MKSKFISSKSTKLNLGSGHRPLKGYFNIDKNSFEGVDKIWDLDKFPYPFKDNTFDLINADSIIEHLTNIENVMKELRRISKPNTLIKISVGYFSGVNSYTDPTHKHFFTYNSFEFFKGFKITKKRLIYSCNPLLSWLNFLPNLFPKVYERFFCYIIPCQALIVEMKVIK